MKSIINIFTVLHRQDYDKLKLMDIQINGKLTQFQNPISIAEMLINLELSNVRVAVERNGEIVPKSLHKNTMLKENDVIEIVYAIGGG